MSKQADREREKARQRQERLDKRYANLRNHTFDDQAYTRNIQENSGRIEDALQQGPNNKILLEICLVVVDCKRILILKSFIIIFVTTHGFQPLLLQYSKLQLFWLA